MAQNIIKRINLKQLKSNTTAILNRFYSVYEPDYLEVGKSEFPQYSTLNIQIRGYVYPTLENYQKLIHKILNHMDIEVDNGWPFPPKKLSVSKYKPFSTTVDSSYDITIYERDIQIENISSIKLPLLTRILESCLPEAVTLNINIYDPEYGRKRYVPDKHLLDLKTELTDLKVKKN